jgi:DNA-binding transcriptional regulator YbjK
MTANTLTVAFAATLLAAGCSGGPSDAEFVQYCMNQNGVQMVKMTEEMCQCAAKYSRENFDARLQRVMVLNMQGRKQEAEALIGDMSFDDRARFAEQQFEVIGQCVMNR